MKSSFEMNKNLPREENAADSMVQISIKKYSTRKALLEIGIKNTSVEYPSVFALVTETIRRLNTLKRIANYILIEKISIRGSDTASLKKYPLFVQNIIYIGIYRTKFEVPEQPFPLVTNCIIEILQKRNFSRFIKEIEILFRILEEIDISSWLQKFEDEIERLSLSTSNPVWLVRSLSASLNYEEIREILVYSNSPPPMYIRVNNLTDSSDLFRELDEKNISYYQDPQFHDIYKIEYGSEVRLPKLRGYEQGNFFIQSRTSAYIPHIIDPQPDHIILDTCAAPGGKTILFAGIMKNQGKIYALEVNKDRFKELEKNLKKYHVSNVQAKNTNILETTFSEEFDIVFIDAPCSGTGTLATRPYIKWNLSKQKVKQYKRLQLQILNHSAKFLKTDTGLLYYVTCSILPEENEEVIKEFLEMNRGTFRSLQLKYALGSSLSYNGQRFFPQNIESEGFTIFCLQKVSEN